MRPNFAWKTLAFALVTAAGISLSMPLKNLAQTEHFGIGAPVSTVAHVVTAPVVPARTVPASTTPLKTGRFTAPGISATTTEQIAMVADFTAYAFGLFLLSTGVYLRPRRKARIIWGALLLFAGYLVPAMIGAGRPGGCG